MSAFPNPRSPIPYPLPLPLPLPNPLRNQKERGHPKTHRKHNHNLPFPFHHDREVEPHLEPPEGLVDEHVADLRRGDEARGAGEEVRGGEGAGLDAEGAEDEEGFFCLCVIFLWVFGKWGW